jgi:hypothetical protein
MDRDKQMELLEQARAELIDAQRKVLHLQQVVDGLSGLLFPADSIATAIPATLRHASVAGRPMVSNRSRATEGAARQEAINRMMHQPQSPNSELPGLTIGSVNESIRPRDAILFVMSSVPGQPMTPKMIYKSIERAGLANTGYKSGQAAYDTALRRLAEEPNTRVVSDPSGAYVYRGPALRLHALRGADGRPEVRVDPIGADDD